MEEAPSLSHICDVETVLSDNIIILQASNRLEAFGQQQGVVFVVMSKAAVWLPGFSSIYVFVVAQCLCVFVLCVVCATLPKACQALEEDEYKGLFVQFIFFVPSKTHIVW